MLSRHCARLFATKRLFSVTVSGAIRAKHTLPDLPYDFGALEPSISAEIMRLHHQKHHATYVNNLNVAEEKFAEAQAKGNALFYGTMFSLLSLACIFVSLGN